MMETHLRGLIHARTKEIVKEPIVPTRAMKEDAIRKMEKSCVAKEAIVIKTILMFAIAQVAVVLSKTAALARAESNFCLEDLLFFCCC